MTFFIYKIRKNIARNSQKSLPCSLWDRKMREMTFPPFGQYNRLRVGDGDLGIASLSNKHAATVVAVGVLV